MKLTPKTLAKFNAAQCNARIFNGNFAIAEIEVFNNKKRYTLRYELSHPSLEEFSGAKDKAELIVWTGCNGVHFPISEDLDPDVIRAKESAQILLNEQVDELAAEMRAAVRGFYEAFYPTC